MKKLHLIVFSFLYLTIVSVQQASAQCSTSTTPTNNCTSGDVINSFMLNSISSNSNNSCTNGYVSFSSPVWNLTIGQSYSFSATVGSGTYSEGFAIWIDLNNNNSYDLNEQVYASTGWGLSHSGSITIPSTATAANNVHMRLRCAYYTTISSSQACTNSIGSYGETEDYSVNLQAACPSPTITAQPQNRTTCETNTTSFNVAANNASTYQWQVNTGSSWANVSGAVYSGATTNSLSLSNIPLSYNNYQYRCIVTGACNNPVNSNAATLTVNPGASIVSQTLSDTICRGAVTALNVTASGTFSGYQWQMAVSTVGIFSNVPAAPPFSGVNSPNLTITGVPDTLNGYLFKCIVVGGQCPSANSSAIPMTVLISPEVVEDPVNDTIYPYNDASFNISATQGSSVVYYWQASADGITYSNINNNSLYKNVLTPALTVKAPTPAMADWWFRCIIKSTDPACGVYHDTSNSAQLKMLFESSVGGLNSNNFNITVYPNPVSGSELFIHSDKAVNGKLSGKVFDKLGRTIIHTDIMLSSNKTASIPVSQLPPGVYSLQLTDAEGNISNTMKFTRE